jgi:hypothetical protein
MGYEIEMRSIPDRLKNEIKVIIWKLIWDDKVNQIDRNVCCLDKKEGGKGMPIIENYIRSKQIKIICKIIHSDLECWNSIGKYWLKKYDNRFGSEYFLCQCSDISGLYFTFLPSYYQKVNKSWNFLLKSFIVDMQMDVLCQTIFGNALLLFNKKPLFFKSFSKSGL